MATPRDFVAVVSRRGRAGDESPGYVRRIAIYCGIRGERPTCTSGSEPSAAREPPDSGAGRRAFAREGRRASPGRRGGDAEGDKNGVGAGAAGEKGTESGTERAEKGTLGLEKTVLGRGEVHAAAAELEFLGVARPVKRRKVEYMQRTAFPLDQLLGESR